MLRILTVLGARPQFVKAAVVSQALASHSGVREIMVHTGQHHDRNMSAVFFDELEIREPDHNLGISGGRHGEQTGRMLQRLEEVMLAEQADIVLVYGDTNSTLAGGLAAAKLGIPVWHVEAGLRSYNMLMPEEINRVLVDHLSAGLFAPTSVAVQNLAREGVAPENVHLVGDVMYDASLRFGALADRKSNILPRLDLDGRRFILATVHRQENTDDPRRLHSIFKALQQVSSAIPVVIPMHPRTHKMLAGLDGFSASNGLRVIEPVGYLDMLRLEKSAAVIVTDSGGVQKEAYFCGVPCVTVRRETEWTELVSSGWNRLVDPGDAAIVEAGIRGVLDAPPTSDRPSFYGSGNSAYLVAEALAGAHPRT